MKIIDSISGPVYAKGEDFEWPSNKKMFYLLTGDGVFLCRNHPFFKSSVKTSKVIAEMPVHESFLEPNYPFICALSMERVVGWFYAVAKKHHSEAIVLLCWNALDKRLEIVCPKQEANGCRVTYTTPTMPPGWTIIGDIHSHVDMSAFSSTTDQTDETHRPGLHIVVGKVTSNRPEFFVNAVVDGEAFTIEDHDTVFAYESLGEWPVSWMNQLTVNRYERQRSSWLPWKKDKYDKEDSYDYTHTTYTPYQGIVDKKDLPPTVDRWMDLPGGKVLKWPTDGEKEIIALYEAELEKLQREMLNI